MSLSLSSLAFCTPFDQWDSGVAATVFFVHQACVTANIASDQASAAKDELQHPCSTACDKVFHKRQLAHDEFQTHISLFVSGQWEWF